MLKILATIDSELSEAEWKTRFMRHGWTLRHRDGLPGGLRRGNLEFTLDGDGFTLLCGTDSQRGGTDSGRDIAPEALLKVLERYAEHFTLEVFEEDGRLVNKIYY